MRNRDRVPFVGEIGPPVRLSRAEECSLAESARGGDRAARESLILANLPLALAWARRRTRGRRPGDEAAYSVAAFHLVAAVDSFDPGVGVRFASYFQRVIYSGFRRDLEAEDARVHVPVRVREVMRRPPGSGLTETQAECLAAARFAAAQNRLGNLPASGPGSDYLVNFPFRSEPSWFGSDRRDLAEAIERLTPIQRAIILARFPPDGGPRLTYARLSRDHLVSTGTIYRIQAEAIAALKRCLLCEAS